MYRVKLNNSGTFVDSSCTTNLVDTFPLLHGWRVRDVAINPIANSGKLWVIIDSTGSTSGPTGGFGGTSTSTKDGGNVLMLTYKTPILLPLNFITFTGKLVNSQVDLNWKTETIEKAAWYEIERSVDKQNFITIGRVTGTEENFTDKLPSIGNNYYRVKAVDANNRPGYTSIINIAYQPAMFVLQVYPNPVKNELNLRMHTERATRLTLQVSNITGTIIHTRTFTARPGMQDIRIDAPGWPSAAYFVKAVGSDGNTASIQKFVK
jgi:hypothetical protein